MTPRPEPAASVLSAQLSAALRAEFPVLETCTYLNSCSTGAMPRGMQPVLERYWDTLRQWRDEVWERWWPQWLGYADALADLVGAPGGSVVTDGNLSTLLGRLATCLDYRGTRRRVVTTDQEFPTVPFLCQALQRLGAEPVVIPSTGGRVEEEQVCAALDERTLLVCLSHASFATGALVDVGQVARAGHAVGALVAVDAYQTVGAVPLDVRALEVDFLLGGAHKWLCGALESAFLYVRPELLPSLEPAATGWVAGEAPLTFTAQTRYAPTARRLGAGTPAVLPALLSEVGLELVRRVGLDAIRAHSLACTARILERADEAGLQVVTPRPPAQRGGTVALRFPGDAEVARALTARGLVCSWRGALRVAPHFYNTLEEVDRFMEALVEEARRHAA